MPVLHTLFTRHIVITLQYPVDTRPRATTRPDRHPLLPVTSLMVNQERARGSEPLPAMQSRDGYT